MTALCVIGLLLGVPLPVLGLAAAAVAFPLPAAAGVLALTVRELRQRRLTVATSPEVAAMIAISGELRAGASLRQALAGAAETLPALASARRLALAGRSMGEVAAVVEAALGRHGPTAGAALRICDQVGGKLAPVFDELAAQAIDADELRRELRAAMAPAVAQGMVVGGVPLLMLVHLATSGELARVAEGSAGAVLVAVGIVFTLAGVAAVAGLVWRAGRDLR